ncbi:hypothetical protein ACKVV7_011369 [Pyricularia oryzae]
MHKRLMHANKAAVLHACQQAGVRISKADADAYLYEATSFGWVLFAKREDTAEVAVEVINFIKLLELQTGITLQIIHTDGGTEFAPKKLKAK